MFIRVAMVVLALFSAPSIRADEPPAEDPVEEIRKMRQETTQIYERLNQNNPLLQGGSARPGGLAAPTIPINPEMLKSLERLEALMDQPVFKTYMRVIANPRVSTAMNEIMRSGKLKNLLYWQIGIMLCFFIYRSWRQSLAETWRQRIWISTWTGLVYFGVAGVIVPSLVLGRPYMQAMSGVIQSIH